MEHSIQVLFTKREAILTNLPTEFDWMLFIPGLLLMMAPLLDELFERKAILKR